jgi:hypothetical protein
VRWVRRYWAEEDRWCYFEVNDKGWVTRQVEVTARTRVPVVAASMTEWFQELVAGRIRAYEEQFGGTADQPIGPDELDAYEPVEAGAFEEVWRQARRHLGDPAYRPED